MIRKLILTAVLAIGTGAGTNATANTAAASQPNNFDHDHGHVRFEVLVRHYRGHWDVYGTFRDRDDAQRAARHLEREGKEVRIEIERDRR